MPCRVGYGVKYQQFRVATKRAGFARKGQDFARIRQDLGQDSGRIGPGLAQDSLSNLVAGFTQAGQAVGCDCASLNSSQTCALVSSAWVKREFRSALRRMLAVAE